MRQFITMEYLTITFVLLPVMCQGQFKAGVQDSVEGTIQLLNGINELLQAGKSTASEPLRSLLSEALFNEKNGILNAAKPKLEQLYDEFFNSNSSTTDDDTDGEANNQTNPFSFNAQTTESSLSHKIKISTESIQMEPEIAQGDLKEESTIEPITHENLYYTVRTTESVPQHKPEEQLIDEPTTPESYNKDTTENDFFSSTVSSISEDNLEKNRNTNIGTDNNSTFDYILSLQNNVCYKLRSGIDSLSNSELVVLLMKFLQYDYLKAKEAWERLKVTTDRIWTAAINDNDDYKRSFGSRKVTEIFRFMDNIKDEIRSSLNILKVPFSTIMRGIKKSFKKTLNQNNEELVEKKDFCMKLGEAERKLRDTVYALEHKFSKMLEEKIKEENKFLEDGKNDSDKMALIDKETVSKDLFFLKDNIFKIYDYINNAAVKQFNKLKGVVNNIQK